VSVAFTGFRLPRLAAGRGAAGYFSRRGASPGGSSGSSISRFSNRPPAYTRSAAPSSDSGTFQSRP